MTILSFGNEVVDEASGSGDMNQGDTITKSDSILPATQSTKSYEKLSHSETATTKLLSQILISTPPITGNESPSKLTITVDKTQSRQGSTVSFGIPSTTIIPKPSKVIVNSHTEVSTKTLDSTHVPEATKSNERLSSASVTRPIHVAATKEKTIATPKDYSKISKSHEEKESESQKETKSKSHKDKDSKSDKQTKSKSHKETDVKKERFENGNQGEWIRRNTFKENNKESGNFAVLFMVAIVMIVALYALYHNRQRIVAIVIEGRSADHRRPNTNKYTKLEDAMPSVRKIMT
eukprot:Seg1279.4 transcript_id=Seg1279.4/GoldUCD/mRNA.D3Y31 product="Trans-Golgi network integral membrane protein 2" protein_id=Seg1279.4/GoldUCD/D3Y31